MKIGPIDYALPGIFEFQCSTQGEWIDRVRLKSGFTFRGIESKIVESRWHHSLLFVDRVSPDLPYFYENLFCEAVEEISSIEVPARAKSIRKILIQLNAIEGSLMYLGRVARALSLHPCFHFFMREREKALDLFELVSGSRGNPNFFRYGGVGRDLSDGFIERLFSLIKDLNFRLREYDSVFFNNPSVQSLLEEIVRFGPNPLEKIRALIEDGLVNLLLLLENLEGGDFFLFSYDEELCVPSGEAIKSIETPRGPAHIYLRSNGTTQPERVLFFTPSQRIFQEIPNRLRGLHVSHISAALHLAGFHMSEVDK